MSNQVIVLNKPFIGKWTEKEGNIAHEVIDFFLDDNGNHYIYNLKSGSLREDIKVNGPMGLKDFSCKYLVLTSKYTSKTKSVNIKYIIELEESLHNLQCPSKNNIKLNENQVIVKNIIKNRDIKYFGKYIYNIDSDFKDLYVTFKVKKMYKIEGVLTFTAKYYKFQHNKGNLFSDKYKEDFTKLNNLIENVINKGQAKTIKLYKITDKNHLEQTIKQLKADFDYSEKHIRAFIERAQHN